jgi:hypothetical protein
LPETLREQLVERAFEELKTMSMTKEEREKYERRAREVHEKLSRHK